MATYECSKCGMSVNATCAKCNAQLVNDSLKLDDGSKVQISKCPNSHGKISRNNDIWKNESVGCKTQLCWCSLLFREAIILFCI